MEHANCRLVTVVMEAALERTVARDLETLGVSGYTFADARGRGSRGVRASSWEHTSNVRLEVLCDAATAIRLMDHLREHYYQSWAMVMWAQDVEVLRPDKFR